MTHQVSAFNLDQLVKRAHGVWQNLAQMAGQVREEKDGVPLQDSYEAEAVEDKAQEVQTLLRLAARSMTELDDMVRTALDRKNGVETAPVTGLRLYEISNVLSLPVEGERSFRDQQIEAGCRELLRDAKAACTDAPLLPCNEKERDHTRPVGG
jgi:hypothetical protein